MKLTLIPQFGTPDQAEMTIHVAGDVLTIDGVVHDLSYVPEGTEGVPAPGSPLIERIYRENGIVHVTVITRLDNTTIVDPDGPWVIEDADGEVPISTVRRMPSDIGQE